MNNKQTSVIKEHLSLSVIWRVIFLSLLFLISYGINFLPLPDALSTESGIISIQLLVASSLVLSVLSAKEDNNEKNILLYLVIVIAVLIPLDFLSGKGLYYVSAAFLILPFVWALLYFKFYKDTLLKFNIFWSNLPDVLIVLFFGYVLSIPDSELSQFWLQSEPLQSDRLNILVSKLIAWYYFIGYIVEIIVKIFYGNGSKKSEVFYLFGHREEIDKEIALLVCSFFVWISVTADINSPSSRVEIDVDKGGVVTVISDKFVDTKSILSSIKGKDVVEVQQRYFDKYKDPENYFILLSLWSLLLLLLSTAKFLLRFDHREEEVITVDRGLKTSGRYHLNYTCQSTHHERFIERNEKNIKNLNSADKERLSSAYYELGKSAHLDDENQKNEKVLRLWYRAIVSGFNLKSLDLSNKKKSNFDDLVLKNYADKESKIDLRAINDYSVLRLRQIIEYEATITEEEAAKDERSIVRERRNIARLLYLGYERDEPNSMYNLAILLSMYPNEFKDSIKKKFIDEVGQSVVDVVVYLLDCAGKLGHKKSYLLREEKLCKSNTESLGGDDFLLISDGRSSENYQVEKFKKPVELFVRAIQVIFMLLAVYLTLEIFKHPQSGNVGKGLGALSLISVGIGVIFKSSIQSIVAGLRIYLDDLARTGDRVESELLNVNGRIESFTLTNIRVRNFDNSLISVALTKYLETPIFNWRMLENSSGRRIRRSLFIDIRTIERFTDDNVCLFDRIMNLESMKKFVKCKEESFEVTQGEYPDLYGDEPSNKYGYLMSKKETECDGHYPDRRFITNLGLYRAYVWQYLHDHDFIDSTSRIVISQLQITPEGLPLEVYAYTLATNEFTDYRAFQNLQSDIFEHIIVSAKFFGLELFQYSESDGDHKKWTKNTDNP